MLIIHRYIYRGNFQSLFCHIALSQSSASHSYGKHANWLRKFYWGLTRDESVFSDLDSSLKTFFGSARAAATVSSLASIEICSTCFTYFMFLLFLFFFSFVRFPFSAFFCCCLWALFLHFLRIFFVCAFPSSHALNYPRSRRALEHPQCGAGHFGVECKLAEQKCGML